jgi:hypothetical protein
MATGLPGSHLPDATSVRAMSRCSLFRCLRFGRVVLVWTEDLPACSGATDRTKNVGQIVEMPCRAYHLLLIFQ